MLKLFRYLKKAYVPVIAIVLLLILQASCDLTLPTFYIQYRQCRYSAKGY